MTSTEQLFADLTAFARVEVASGDLEPWALLLNALRDQWQLPDEHVLWLVKLYNATDAFSSAWQIYRRWPTPHHWAQALDALDAAQYPCTQERRNLRGGRILQHFWSYVGHLRGQTQRQWLQQAPQHFLALMAWVRHVWGVGRQTAFEWVEFLAKVAAFPLRAPHACLWESEGPRRSLQSLFGNPAPSPADLERYAHETRALLASRGVSLPWEDFETVICDFHVMRLGRYYPGRHLAALRGEIAEVPDLDDQRQLLDIFRAIIPAPWHAIPPGINKALLPVYRQTGQIVPVERAIAC